MEFAQWASDRQKFPRGHDICLTPIMHQNFNNCLSHFVLLTGSFDYRAVVITLQLKKNKARFFLKKIRAFMLRGKFKFSAVCRIFSIALSHQRNLQQNIAQCATDKQPRHSTASLEFTLLLVSTSVQRDGQTMKMLHRFPSPKSFSLTYLCAHLSCHSWKPCSYAFSRTHGGLCSWLLLFVCLLICF